MPELNEFAKASVNGIPLILVVIGLVEYAKRLGAQDRGLLVVSMGTGLVLGAGYQLLRQQALAEGCAQSGRYGRVASCVAYDARNRTLIGCLRDQGITDFRTGWGPLFQGLAPFVSFSHQEWVAWVAANDHAGMWQEWLAYVTVRYDFAVGADHVSA